MVSVFLLRETRRAYSFTMWTETRARSVVKTIGWRIVATANSFVVSFWFFGELLAAGTAAILMNVSGFFIMYLWERIWNKVQWGKQQSRS